MTKRVDVATIHNAGKPDIAVDLPLELPELGSVLDSTHPSGMLMFRGNPSHTQYGTAPSSLNVRWTSMKDFHTRLRGRRITWREPDGPVKRSPWGILCLWARSVAGYTPSKQERTPAGERRVVECLNRRRASITVTFTLEIPTIYYVALMPDWHCQMGIDGSGLRLVPLCGEGMLYVGERSRTMH